MIQLFLPFTPLPCARVRRAIESLGFVKTAQHGSHEQYEKIEGGRKYKVTLDCHHGEVSAKVVKSIVGQCGVSKADFLKALQK